MCHSFSRLAQREEGEGRTTSRARPAFLRSHQLEGRSLSYNQTDRQTVRQTDRQANITLVLMYSGIEYGYQLLRDAHTVLEHHRGIADLFLFNPLLSIFHSFLFVFVIVTGLFLFWGTSIVCVYNLTRAEDLV